MTRRRAWWALGITVVVIAVAVAGVAAVRWVTDDCRSAVPFAERKGLDLSADETVVSCDMHSSFPDSWANLEVRTKSPVTREALVKRSGATPGGTDEDDPAVFVYGARPEYSHILRIRYDKRVERGLLLKVNAADV